MFTAAFAIALTNSSLHNYDTLLLDTPVVFQIGALNIATSLRQPLEHDEQHD